MGENTLAVKVTADIASLQAQFATAQASTAALRKEMADLAKQSAAGVLDPAGLAQLQEASRAFLEAKNSAKDLQNQLKGTREESVNLGEGLSEIKGQISSAFEAAGVTLAYEAIKQVGEAIETLGERATQIHAMSEVLGITVEQFQAMGAAAEEGGTSVEIFARAEEKLITLLTQAREGSGEARQKLFDLGATLAQINDPAFKVNDLLGILRDRLNDSATAQQTMNDLIKEFGPRAALAAEAIKAYDGSTAGVAATMARLNGLTDEQTHKLHEMAVAAKEAWTWVVNTASKVLSLGGVDRTDEGVGKFAEKDDSAQSAQAQMDLQREMAQQELQNIQAGVEAYKQGSAQKLEQLKEFHAATAAFYGADSDKAAAAQRQEIAEERAFQDAQASLRAEEVRDTIKADDASVKARLAGIKLSIDANEQFFSDAVRVHNAIESMEQTGLEIQTHIYQQRAQLSAQANAIAARETKEQLANWQFLTNGMKSGFTSAIQGILSGTENMGQAMRGIFTSVLDGIISKLAEWAAEWVTKLIITQAANEATAAVGVAANSSVAATAAMASVAAIPFIGWAMAPEVGATTYAEGMAYMASASQGYDVPLGLSPITQLHSEEMVLPRPEANVIRGLADQGGGGGGRTVHIHGKAGSTFTQDQLVSMLRNLGHQFKLV